MALALLIKGLGLNPLHKAQTQISPIPYSPFHSYRYIPFHSSYIPFESLYVHPPPSVVVLACVAIVCVTGLHWHKTHPYTTYATLRPFTVCPSRSYFALYCHPRQWHSQPRPLILRSRGFDGEQYCKLSSATNKAHLKRSFVSLKKLAMNQFCIYRVVGDF